jgi:hypothetical protein
MTIGGFGLDRADLGDGDLEVGEHLEQEGLERLVGAVELVDQQHRRAPGVGLERLQQRPLDQEAAVEDVAAPGARGRGRRPPRRCGSRSSARVVPLVDGGGDVEALVALQADQPRPRRSRPAPWRSRSCRRRPRLRGTAAGRASAEREADLVETPCALAGRVMGAVLWLVLPVAVAQERLRLEDIRVFLDILARLFFNLYTDFGIELDIQVDRDRLLRRRHLDRRGAGGKGGGEQRRAEGCLTTGHRDHFGFSPLSVARSRRTCTIPEYYAARVQTIPGADKRRVSVAARPAAGRRRKGCSPGAAPPAGWSGCSPG